METTDEEGWVTCPEVLQLMAQARAFRPGDLVKLMKLENIYIEDPRLEGKVVPIINLTEKGATHGWNSPRTRVLLVGTIAGSKVCSTWLIAVENIAAWKRPT